MPIDHYENFPVASFLLPRHLHRPVTAIYAFARSADDIADEGDATADTRLGQLDAYRAELNAIEQGRPPGLPLFERLGAAIREHALPLQPFRDLLDAFSQDVVKQRYSDYPELLDYCRRSANPVGHLMLHLYRVANPANLRRSDCICTALQLINFWQDVAFDWRKPRIYLPQDDLARFGVAEIRIGERKVDDRWRALMRFEIGRARNLMLEGASLGHTLPGRIGLELRLVIAGGLRILEKIERVDYDVFERRPVLTARDWPLLSFRALFGTVASQGVPQNGPNG